LRGTARRVLIALIARPAIPITGAIHIRCWAALQLADSIPTSRSSSNCVDVQHDKRLIPRSGRDRFRAAITPAGPWLSRRGRYCCKVQDRCPDQLAATMFR
jgi:hypothetical protein